MGEKTSRPVQPAHKPLARRLLFWCFVMSPLAVLALLMWIVAGAIERGPQMENQRIGAGAGDTGGANAIGDIMAGRWDDAGEAATGEAGDGDAEGDGTPEKQAGDDEGGS